MAPRSSAGALNVTATDKPTINAFAGGVGLAVANPYGVAVGASYATNSITSTVSAFISGSSATTTAGSVTFSATSTSLMETITVGGSVAGAVSAAGAVSLDNISDVISAYASKSAQINSGGASPSPLPILRRSRPSREEYPWHSGSESALPWAPIRLRTK